MSAGERRKWGERCILVKAFADIWRRIDRPDRQPRLGLVSLCGGDYLMPRCKVCKEPYERTRPLQVACSLDHALKYAREQREKKERKELREAKRRLKTRADWLKEAQGAFNAYIRERDRELPCISCGRHHQGQWHAGHYRSVGAHPELRFEPANVHKQCAPCNNHLSGNAVEYRIALVKRIGFELVAWLEGPHDPKKYAIDELIEIKQRYTRMRRELEKERL